MAQIDDSPTVTRFAFELVISAWDESLQCEHSTKGGGHCRRPAKWRVDAHGCEKLLMCTNHLHGYEGRVAASFRPGKSTSCPMCGKAFTSPAAVYKATPL